MAAPCTKKRSSCTRSVCAAAGASARLPCRELSVHQSHMQDAAKSIAPTELGACLVFARLANSS